MPEQSRNPSSAVPIRMLDAAMNLVPRYFATVAFFARGIRTTPIDDLPRRLPALLPPLLFLVVNALLVAGSARCLCNIALTTPTQYVNEISNWEWQERLIAASPLVVLGVGFAFLFGTIHGKGQQRRSLVAVAMYAVGFWLFVWFVGNLCLELFFQLDAHVIRQLRYERPPDEYIAFFRPPVWPAGRWWTQHLTALSELISLTVSLSLLVYSFVWPAVALGGVSYRVRGGLRKKAARRRSVYCAALFWLFTSAAAVLLVVYAERVYQSSVAGRVTRLTVGPPTGPSPAAAPLDCTIELTNTTNVPFDVDMAGYKEARLQADDWSAHLLLTPRGPANPVRLEPGVAKGFDFNFLLDRQIIAKIHSQNARHRQVRIILRLTLLLPDMGRIDFETKPFFGTILVESSPAGPAPAGPGAATGGGAATPAPAAPDAGSPSAPAEPPPRTEPESEAAAEGRAAAAG